MTRPLALVRPEPGWSASAAAARQQGLVVVGHPLFVAEPVSWTPPSGEFDALLTGSAAVFRHGGPQLAALAALPVYAVGEATAAAAVEAGFAVALTGEGGLQQLLDGSAGEARRFLRLAGEERVVLHPHPGQGIVDCPVYRMTPRPIDDDFTRELDERKPLVALHSAAAARHFAQEVDRLGLSRGSLFLAALGSRIAKSAGLGWAALHIADQPNDAALLAKACALCK